MSSLMKYFLVGLLWQWIYAMGCGEFGKDITCTCINDSVSCDGFDDGGSDIVEIISNISTVHYSSSELNGVFISIKSLNISLNTTLHGLQLKELKLGFGLEKLGSDLLIGLNSTLVRLDLQENNFEHVPFQTIQALGKLEYLDLSHNKIVSLTHEEFVGLENLKILKLEHNSIYILLNPFTPLKNLEILALDFNKLPQNQLKELKNLPNLKRLSLSSNNIREFHSEDIKSLHFLTKLTIDNNKIFSLTRMNISSSSLKELSASNCSIQGVLSKTVLGNLPNLVVLDLSLNNLTEIMPFALSNLQKLEVMNLSRNSIEAVRDDAFSSVSSLQDLDLSGNGLSLLQKDAFRNLTKLKTMNLNENSLVGFFCSYTTDLFALEKMELKRNQIHAIHPGTFLLSPHLNTLKLDGNAFDCNTTCETAFLSSYLQNNTLLTASDVDAVVCQTPLHLRGQRLIDVPIKPLNCPVYVANATNPCRFLEPDDYDYDDDDIDEATSSTLSDISSTSAETSTTEATTLSLGFSDSTSTDTSTTDATTLSLTSTITDASTIDAGTSATISTITETTFAGTTTFPPTSTETYSTPAPSTSSAYPPSPHVTELNKTETTPTEETISAIYNVSIWNATEGSSKTFDTDVTGTTNSTLISTSDMPTRYGGTTVAFIPVAFIPVFNITYFDIYYYNSSSVVIEWKVTESEDPSDCYIEILLERKNLNGKYPCYNKSYVLNIFEVAHDEGIVVCLTSHHVIYGSNSVCKRLHPPHREAASSKELNKAQSNLSLNILITLLVLAVCLVLFIAARHMKKQCAGSRYDVSEKENKVQRRTGQKLLDNTSRASYIRQESFDI